jgi:outer membrane protein assembly factor BamB
MFLEKRSTGLVLLWCVLATTSCQKRLIPKAIDWRSLPKDRAVETGSNSRFLPDRTIHPPLESRHEFRLSSAPKQKIERIGHILLVPTKDGRLESIDLVEKKKIGQKKIGNDIQANVTPIGESLLVSLEFGKESLFLFDPAENETIWKAELGSIKTYPILYEDKIFVASLYRGIFCLDTNNGSILWNTPLQSQLHANPVIHNSYIVQGTESGMVAALALETGEVKWKLELKSPILASPISVAGKAIFCTNEGTVAAVSSDGKLIWEKKFGVGFRRTPAAVDNKLIIAGQDGVVRALDINDGSLLWSYEAGTVIGTTPVAMSQYVIFGTLDKRLMYLSLETGQEIWEIELFGRVRTDPVLWEDQLILGSENNYIYILESSAASQRAAR